MRDASPQFHPAWQSKLVVQIYERTRQRKGHSVAVGAVARYLAEATFWVLKKGEPYREPVAKPPPGRTPGRCAGSKSAASSKQGQAPAQHGSSEIRELTPVSAGGDWAAPAEYYSCPIEGEHRPGILRDRCFRPKVPRCWRGETGLTSSAGGPGSRSTICL